jgi:hypothetical protein
MEGYVGSLEIAREESWVYFAEQSPEALRNVRTKDKLSRKENLI